MPLFIRSWKKVLPEAQVQVILIAEEIPTHLSQYQSSIVLFSPLTDISTAFISQYIRILYPALLSVRGAVLISDVDMLPMNRQFFARNIQDIPNDHFVYLRDVLLEVQEIAICYNAASPAVWGEIFRINTIEDVRKRLTEIGESLEYANVHGGTGWNKDQSDLHKHVTDWNVESGRFTHLIDTKTGYQRLDGKHLSYKWGVRNLIRHIKNIVKVRLGKYSDFHAQGPNTEYEKFNSWMIRLIRRKR